MENYTFSWHCMLITLCSKRSDTKTQITVTTAYLMRIKYPLSGFNYHLSEVNVANFDKIHRLIGKWDRSLHCDSLGGGATIDCLFGIILVCYNCVIVFI